ncbi:AbrB/MazE/SpoVT family DNA-binding domain-containing protein [uncultured Alsobacter sp.]|uniref:AbrB/MazE/SpoVT family DNA-binding domain-containing protein n=1 Tax=uncultured Alsobacter sp. TaxID=1748258 RepID=UPI0025DC5449|nr:AbrB/MazE/SpoVT family DNA-binding domain-containing protein [uncultured Alsobacter sp.]
MKVQIAKWGNSAAVRLPKAVLDELGLQPGSELDMVVEAGQLRLSPRRRTPTLEQIVAEMTRLGGAAYDYGQNEWPDPVEDWPEYTGQDPS